MYFSNIANDELSHFHKINGVDFSISLSEIINGSDLFKIDEIIENKIYRIYPLFYCKNIVSNNANDINLNNQCLIVEKRDNHETYISFMTNEERNNIILNESVLDVKSINDNLSIAEFNALVYLLRKTGVISKELSFENSVNVEGDYGTYQFKNVSELQTDTGVIINDEIKQNPITVTLNNPYFLNARYTLTFTVKSLTGVNVCDGINNDYKVIDTFDVVLQKNQEVSLDVSQFTNDSVLLFDFSVEVSFDVHEIINNNFYLDLICDSEEVFVGDTFSLYAELTGDGNVEEYVVNFFENDVFIGSAITDENGVAELSHSQNTEGNYVYSCSVLGLSQYFNVDIRKRTSSISIGSIPVSPYYTQDFEINGKLEIENESVENIPIDIYHYNTFEDTVVTNEAGEFSKTITTDYGVGQHIFSARCESSQIETSENSVTVPIRPLQVRISMRDMYIGSTKIKDSKPISVGTKVRFEADLSFEDGTSAIGHDYVLKFGDEIIEEGTVTTNHFAKSHTFNDVTTRYYSITLTVKTKGIYVGKTESFLYQLKVV